MTQKSFSMYKTDRCDKMRRRNGILPPSEGVRKNHENASPSEGGTWPFPRISVLQALYGQCRIFPSSEGVQKRHGNASPSEGGTWTFPRISVLQALYGQCRIFPPSEGVQKRHGNASPLEGGTWPFPRISVLQALYGQCRIFPPTEGGQKNHENALPSKGVQRRSISIEFRNGGLCAGCLQDGVEVLDDVGMLRGDVVLRRHGSRR